MEINKLQTDYTPNGSIYQLALIPTDIGELIPCDDSVRLLSAILERMNYSKLYDAYSRMGRIETSPKNLFKIMVYGYMNGIYSSRKLEISCRRDINFMYLLGREAAPDHSTIARFRSERLKDAIEGLFCQLVDLLKENGEISCKNLLSTERSWKPMQDAIPSSGRKAWASMRQKCRRR